MAVQIVEQGPQPDITLIDDVLEYIERFVELATPGQSLVEAVWVIHSWLIEIAMVTPYLYISSKGPGSGKTRNMDVLATLVRNPDSGTDSPVHVLAQEIAASQPTLFFDEIDTVFAGRAAVSGLKRVLNIGYVRGAVIKRQRANAIEVWPVFCAKVMAGIRNNHLPDSLLSRAIPIEMSQRRKKLERFNKFRTLRDPQRQELVDRLAAFAEEFAVDVALQRPEPVKALDDRRNEIVEPLLQIAIVLDKEAELREALVNLYQGDRSRPSREQALLARIKRAFDLQAAQGGSDKAMHTEDLIAALGSYYTPRTLSIVLKEFGFERTASETVRIGNKVKRGYARADFEPLFDRWLDDLKPDLELIEDEDEEGEAVA